MHLRFTLFQLFVSLHERKVTISARLAARFGRDPAVACLAVGGAGGAGGFAVLVRVGLFAGAGGGAFLPVAAFATGGLGALGIPPGIRLDGIDPLPFAMGGVGADATAATGFGLGLASGTRPAGLG